jgi:selenocysteine lyase/cysteine desulfurase
MDAIQARIRALLARLEEGLRGLGCDVGPAPEHRAGILTFLPPQGEARALGAWLAERDVACSLRRGRIRLSPHFYNLPEEMDRLVELVRTHRG